MQAHESSCSTVRVVRRAEYLAMPWRNGFGTTYEIARDPASGPEFSWRLSLALIEHSGPFSNFAGYQRAISLVSGAGCVLHGIDSQPVQMSIAGTTTLFPGDATVDCELIAGPCQDLNLMVRAPGDIVSAGGQRLGDGDPRPLVPGYENAIFCLSGAVECVCADGTRATLGEHDTMLVDASAAASWRIRAARPGGAQVLAHAWFTRR
jgi:uncharacterized protein